MLTGVFRVNRAIDVHCAGAVSHWCGFRNCMVHEKYQTFVSAPTVFECSGGQLFFYNFDNPGNWLSTTDYAFYMQIKTNMLVQ